MNDADRRIARGLFILTFVAYAWFFGGGGWNQNASFDLTRAIVERGTFAIDAYRDNTYDIAFGRGQVYANKAPGLSLLAAIPYAALYGIEHAIGVDPNAFFALTVNQWLCTVAICATSGALLVALFFIYSIGLADRLDALVVALAIAFGTYLFAYATVFFFHVPSALFLFWCFVERHRPLRAGVLGGLSVICNYAALPAVLLIVIVSALERPRDIMRFVAGGAPFALALLAYQWVCFGSPFRTSIDAESAVFHTQNAPFGVLVAPRLGVLVAILFSRFRGLFVLSPVLLLAVPGAAFMIERRDRLRDLLIIIGVFVVFVALNISFNNWDGGSAIGPRYILPVVPFLAIPILYVARRWRLLFATLAALSILINFAVVAVNPLPSRTIHDPIFTYTFPLLVTGRLPRSTPPFPPYAWKQSLGHVSVNRHSVDELVAFVKHPPGSPEAEWASFNVGELLVPGSVLSLFPIVVWIFGGMAFLYRRT